MQPNIIGRAGAAAAMVALSVISGCLNDEFPSHFNPPPASCGNGSCELADEDCDNCPGDCRHAVSTASSEGVGNVDGVKGAPDENSATLNGFSSIVLVVGREIYDLTQDDGQGLADFKLVGSVTSTPSSETGICAFRSDGTGGFGVHVSLDGASYEKVGLWTQKNNQFDVGCTGIKAARYIRIEGQPGAEGTLDALVAESCPDIANAP